MRHMLSAPSRESGIEAAAFGAPSCAWATRICSRVPSVPRVPPRPSSLPFSHRRGRPAAAAEIRLGVIEQSTRLDGDGFPALPSPIENPSGRRVYRPAGSVPVGITKER